MFASGSLNGASRVYTTRLATVIVDVDDPAGGRRALGDLMRVAGGRDPRADVSELPDPRLGGEKIASLT